MVTKNSEKEFSNISKDQSKRNSSSNSISDKIDFFDNKSNQNNNDNMKNIEENDDLCDENLDNSRISNVSNSNKIDLIVYEKQMKDVKNENYRLKLENEELKKQFKNNQDKFKDSDNANLSDDDDDSAEINEFEGKKQNRLHNLTNNNNNLDDTTLHFQIEKADFEKKFKKLNEEMNVLRDKLRTSEELNNDLIDKQKHHHKQIEEFDKLKSFHQKIIEECNFSHTDQIDNLNLIDSYKSMLIEKYNIEIKQNYVDKQICEFLEDLLLNFIELLHAFSQVNNNASSLNSITEKKIEIENKLREASNFQFFVLDVQKAIETLMKINIDAINDAKSVSQFPISQMMADITVMDNNNNSNNDNANHNHDSSDKFLSQSIKKSENRSFAAFSTPCLKSRRLEELRRDFADISTELFQSVSNIRTELAVDQSCGVVSAQSTRISTLLPNNNNTNNDGNNNYTNNNSNTNLDQGQTMMSNFNEHSTFNNTTNFLDRTDINFAKVNTLIVKLQQLVEQNNQLQDEMIGYMTNNKDLQSTIENYEKNLEEKNENIKELNDLIGSLEIDKESLEKILILIREKLGCKSSEVMENIDLMIENIEDFKYQIEEYSSEIDSLKFQLDNNRKEFAEKNINIGNLESEIENLKVNLLQSETALQDTKNRSDKVEKEKIDENIVFSKEILAQIGHKNLKEWNELRMKIDDLLNSAEPLFKIDSSMIQLDQLDISTKLASYIQNKPLKRKQQNSSTMENEDELSTNRSQEEMIDKLQNHIAILQNEIEEGKNEIESLKISNSLPEKITTSDPKLDELVQKIVKLQELLEKSYQGNKNLRQYFKQYYYQTPSIPNSTNNNNDDNSNNNTCNNDSKNRANLMQSSCVNVHKTFSNSEISQIEQTIQDSLAVLRNLAKLIKHIDMQLNEFEKLSNKSSNSNHQAHLKDTSGNVYKCKKALKVMQRKLLQIYRSIICEDIGSSTYNNIQNINNINDINADVSTVVPSNVTNKSRNFSKLQESLKENIIPKNNDSELQNLDIKNDQIEEKSFEKDNSFKKYEGKTKEMIKKYENSN